VPWTPQRRAIRANLGEGRVVRRNDVSFGRQTAAAFSVAPRNEDSTSSAGCQDGQPRRHTRGKLLMSSSASTPPTGSKEWRQDSRRVSSLRRISGGSRHFFWAEIQVRSEDLWTLMESATGASKERRLALRELSLLDVALWDMRAAVASVRPYRLLGAEPTSLPVTIYGVRGRLRGRTRQQCRERRPYCQGGSAARDT